MLGWRLKPLHDSKYFVSSEGSEVSITWSSRLLVRSSMCYQGFRDLARSEGFRTRSLGFRVALLPDLQEARDPYNA